MSQFVEATSYDVCRSLWVNLVIYYHTTMLLMFNTLSEVDKLVAVTLYVEHQIDGLWFSVVCLKVIAKIQIHDEREIF